MSKKDVWEDVSLSDPDTVRALLKFKSQFFIDDDDDIDWDRRGLTSNCDLNQMSEDLIVTYLDLQNLVKDTIFKGNQKEILKLYSKGYTEEEIAQEIGVTRPTVINTLDVICKEIVATNRDKWEQDFIYWNKKRVKTDYKKCNRCGQFLPKTDKYFGVRKDSKDGFRDYCKKCR